MLEFSTEYICAVSFNEDLPDENAWRRRPAEYGLSHESFTIAKSPSGNPMIKFWEPDRTEALRILSKIDGLAGSTQH